MGPRRHHTHLKNASNQANKSQASQNIANQPSNTCNTPSSSVPQPTELLTNQNLSISATSTAAFKLILFLQQINFYHHSCCYRYENDDQNQ